jgi:hypothetical protein
MDANPRVVRDILIRSTPRASAPLAEIQTWNDWVERAERTQASDPGAAAESEDDA